MDVDEDVEEYDEDVFDGSYDAPSGAPFQQGVFWM